MFESAEALSFAAAWTPIISRTTLIPASLFVMIESSCKAQVTSPPQGYQNGSTTHKLRKTRSAPRSGFAGGNASEAAGEVSFPLGGGGLHRPASTSPEQLRKAAH